GSALSRPLKWRAASPPEKSRATASSIRARKVAAPLQISFKKYQRSFGFRRSGPGARVPERRREFARDSPLEEARFEPSVPLWLGALTRSKKSMSGPVGVGGFEEGEFEGDGPLEKVAAQILSRGADAVQLRAQEIDKAAKPRIVVQRDPLGVHEIDRQRLRRAGGPVEIEPFGHDEDRKRGGIAARFCGLAHDR